MKLYKKILKPILFKFHPDYVHIVIVKLGKVLGHWALGRMILRKFFFYENKRLTQNIFGYEFKNPIGIGGGFDKNADLIKTLPACGFGFVEIGSVTARAYKGNKRPWSVRLPEDQSLIVNYGLKNIGADKISQKIGNHRRSVPLIINIAKTNDISIKGNYSIADYVYSFQKLQDKADIINLNISCPNTGDGVLFCESPELLDKLFLALSKAEISKPILLKLKPDISDNILYKICDLANKYIFIKGFIISNLTVHRENLTHTSLVSIEKFRGGISGAPVKNLSNDMISKIYKYTNGKFIIIGLGGVFNAKDAYEKISLGANLVEIVTGLIYEGPSVVQSINKGLVELLEADGFTNIVDAIGCKNK